MKFGTYRFVQWMQATLLALALFAVPATAEVAAQSAIKEATQLDTPAIWKIQGPKGKVYLFGSFHLLPDNVQWRSPAVEQALNEAEIIVHEVDIGASADPQQVQPLINRYGMLPQGKTLKDALPPPVYAELGRACIDMGVQRQQFSASRPWFAAYTLSLHAMMSLGFNPMNGVEIQSYMWGKARKKQFGALETIEQQLRLFADLSPEQEVQFVQASLEQIRETQKMLRPMLAAYRTGDVVAIDKLMNESMIKYPHLRDRLLKERNAKWVPQIEKMLQDGRTHIVIVGVGHLVGQESVINMLRAKNIAVEGPGQASAKR